MDIGRILYITAWVLVIPWTLFMLFYILEIVYRILNANVRKPFVTFEAPKISKYDILLLFSVEGLVLGMILTGG